MFFTNLANAARGELDVDITGALPQIHFAPSPFHYPSAQILVRHKKNVAIGWSGLDDFLSVPAGANDIAECFHPCAAIDVSNHIIIFVGILFQKRSQGWWRTGFRK